MTDEISTDDVVVRELDGDAEWKAAVPVLRELWTDADDAFVKSFRDEPDYHVLGAYRPTPANDPSDPSDSGGSSSSSDSGGSSGSSDGTCEIASELVAVAGVSVQRVLHHARHAWVHDLVVTEPARGEGVGAALLDGVESWARARECEYVALAVRDRNDDAKAFYDAEGMTEWGSVYEREL